MARRFFRSWVVLSAALGIGACDGPQTMEQVKVTMQQTDAALTQSLSGWSARMAGSEGSAAAISKDTVSTLVVRITRIEFLPKEEEAREADPGAWIALDLTQPVIVDLMALPTEGSSPLVIASGTVPVGNYGDVRLFTDSAAIRFKGPIELGVAFKFEGNTTYQVTIPSVEQTGIKTDAEFTVEAETDVNLLFSPTATFLNVTGTGTGQVILAPVIRSRPQ
ncbi:hypothetical protein HRbin33_02561 [bacterium HR33]|nr:hypothetical protein HRbin33_02561 [bacterium HR33]